MTNTILTNKGVYFDFNNPEAHDFPIEEIAHSLSHLCRYTGHTRKFYSVAQHSVIVSHCVPARLAMAGLLHDAAEAYLGDVASPLKRMLPDYKVIERRVEMALFTRHGLAFPMQPDIKTADIRVLITEKRDLMGGGPDYKEECGGLQWPDVLPLDFVIRPLKPKAAKEAFLQRYQLLLEGW